MRLKRRGKPKLHVRPNRKKKLREALAAIAEEYGERRTMPLEVIKKVATKVRGINAEQIDWPEAVNGILMEVK